MFGPAAKLLSTPRSFMLRLMVVADQFTRGAARYRKGINQMMFPLVLAMAFLSPVGACADLTGQDVHAGEDNRVYVSIDQTRCEGIAITWDTSWPPARVPVRLVLDGRFHPTNPGWFGFHQVSTSLDDTTLKVVMVASRQVTPQTHTQFVSHY